MGLAEWSHHMALKLTRPRLHELLRLCGERIGGKARVLSVIKNQPSRRRLESSTYKYANSSTAGSYGASAYLPRLRHQDLHHLCPGRRSRL